MAYRQGGHVTSLPTVPPEVITVAAVAIRQHWHAPVLNDPDVTRILATAALEAAAPHLAHGHGPDVSVNPGCQACKNAADAERERITRLAGQHGATYQISGDDGAPQPFAALLREDPDDA